MYVWVWAEVMVQTHQLWEGGMGEKKKKETISKLCAWVDKFVSNGDTDEKI